MQSKYTSLNSLLLVIGIHASVLAAVVMTRPEPAPVGIVEPTIQGILVMAEPEEAPPPPEVPPPPPEKKPEPQKPKPLPKAPPSERAVKAPEPAPTPLPEEKPVEQKQAEPAPVVPPGTDASERSNPAPTYPSISRRLGEKGTVTLEILVKASGTVGEVKVKKTSGYKRLDTAAINAIKRWHFVPASQAGIAIDYWYEIDFDFGIRGKK